MIDRWDQELVRVLTNWALWSASKGNHGLAYSAIYGMGPSGPRAGNTFPILSGEASDADGVITRLSARYQQPLRMHYCWPGRSDRSKAAACSCCLNTYKSRLDYAHVLFSQGWYARAARPPRVA